MKSEKNTKWRAKADQVFKALGDYRRRMMLEILKEGPYTTGEICERFPEIDRCTVMQHLKVLEKAKLIRVEKVGKFRWNHLNLEPLKLSFEGWFLKMLPKAPGP